MYLLSKANTDCSPFVYTGVDLPFWQQLTEVICSVRMEYRLVLCLHLLSFVPHSAIKNCSSANYCEVLIWGPWSTCSTGCGRGLRHRLPGLCCPKGVTAQTIYAECAVKLCNMTEGDYNQTVTCSSTLGCTSGRTTPGPNTVHGTNISKLFQIQNIVFNFYPPNVILDFINRRKWSSQKHGTLC